MVSEHDGGAAGKLPLEVLPPATAITRDDLGVSVVRAVIPHVVITDGDSYRIRQARAKGGTTTNKN